MTSKLDLAAMREVADATNNDEWIALLDAVEQLLAIPTPMPSDKSDDFGIGWDTGWNRFRREARKIFGVGDE